MPQSLLGSLPVCHQHFFQAAFLTYILVLTAVQKKKKGLSQLFFTHLRVSIYILQMGSNGPAYVVIVQYFKSLKNTQT